MNTLMNRLRNRLEDNERGTTLEVVIYGAGMLMVLLFVIAAFRIGGGYQSIQAAASAAARDASIARNPSTAYSNAMTAARSTLEQQGIRCSPLDVQVDVSGFAAPVGTPASIRVDITCNVPLGDLAVPGLPGHRVITAHAESVLDTFRIRGTT